jgi:hypothetical protein
LRRYTEGKQTRKLIGCLLSLATRNPRVQHVLVDTGRASLVHFSPQPEPFSTLKTSPKLPKFSSISYINPLQHPLNNPCPTKSAYVELEDERL